MTIVTDTEAHALEQGELLGAKPPLVARHVWPIRTKLKIERRACELANVNLAMRGKRRGCDVVDEGRRRCPERISRRQGILKRLGRKQSRETSLGQSIQNTAGQGLACHYVRSKLRAAQMHAAYTLSSDQERLRCSSMG